MIILVSGWIAIFCALLFTATVRGEEWSFSIREWMLLCAVVALMIPAVAQTRELSETDIGRLATRMKDWGFEGPSPWLQTRAVVVDLKTGELQSFRAEEVCDEDNFGPFSDLTEIKSGANIRHAFVGNGLLEMYGRPDYIIQRVSVSDEQVMVVLKTRPPPEPIPIPID